MVSWAKGCGHEGEVSPYSGGGKLPWKVEWAAKWPTVGVVCELAGKDHFTKGGSRSIAVAISVEVLDFPPPFPSTPKDTGRGYEFFTVGGKKMSTSKGTGMGFAEMTDYLPADMLRYLLVRTRPKAKVDFDPLDDNDMILLYDRYDTTQRIYHGKESVSEREFEQEKRIYEFSAIEKMEKKMPPQISLTYAATVIQIYRDVKKAAKILQKTGHLPKNIPSNDLDYVSKRLEFAKQWVEKFASDRYKFELQEKPRVKVEAGVRKVMKVLAVKLERDGLKEDKLLNLIYDLCKDNDVKTREFFRSMYNILINKDYGPRLVPFILSIGKKRIAKILREV